MRSHWGIPPLLPSIILLLTACPAIAFVFTLPRLDRRTYLVNGYAAALVMSLVAGAQWIEIDEELGPLAFVEGFLLTIVPTLLGLLLGSLVLHWLTKPRRA